MVEVPQPKIDANAIGSFRSPVSGADIAAPHQILAHLLEKTGEGLDAVSIEAAKRAGYAAADNMSWDANGNPVVQHAPIVGPAAKAYQDAIQMGTLSSAEGEIKRQEIALRQQFHDDPEGYQKAAEALRQDAIKRYGKISPEVGYSVGKVAENATTYTYRGLVAQKEHDDLKRATAETNYNIERNTNEVWQMLRSGADPSSPDVQAKLSDISAQYQRMIDNPRMGFPQAQADYEMKHHSSEFAVASFLHHNEETYKKPIEEGGGYKNALEQANELLTSDKYSGLTEADRHKFYQRAKSELHVSEAIKKQDVVELRGAIADAKESLAEGNTITPGTVQSLASTAENLGYPSLAIGVKSYFRIHGLNDGWPNMPIEQQTKDLRNMGAGTGAAPRSLAEHVASFEDEPLYKGEIPSNKAKWDYKQYSVGFGSRARSPTESLNREQAMERLGNELTGDAQRVESFAPNAPPGVKLALTSLSHNAGTAWMNSGLGKAVQEGDWDKAKELFLQYRKAGDEVLPGLVRRRETEAKWWDTGGPGGVPAKMEGGGGPPTGEPSWLVAGRSAATSKVARAQWDAIEKDWQKDQAFPAQNRINAIFDAADATGDVALTEKMTRSLDAMEMVRDAGQVDSPQLAQTIAAASKKLAENTEDVGMAALRDQLQKKLDARTKGMKEDAPFFAAQSIPRLQTPAPLNLSDPKELDAGLKLREHNVAVASKTFHEGPYSALGKEDLKQIQGVLEQTKDPAVKASIYASLNKIGDEDIRGATLAAVGSKSTKTMAEAWAGGLLKEDPQMATALFNGQNKYDADHRLLPHESGQTAVTGVTKGSWDNKLDEKFPPYMFHPDDRADPNGQWKTMRHAIEMRYADLADLDGHDVSGKIDEQRMNHAVSDVMGGYLLNHNGYNFIAPKRGGTQQDFDRQFDSIDPAEFSQVTTKNGRLIDKDYIWNNGTFTSVGEGKYLVQLGVQYDQWGQPQPIYAYGPDGKPWALDMRDRKIKETSRDLGTTRVDQMLNTPGVQFSSEEGYKYFQPDQLTRGVSSGFEQRMLASGAPGPTTTETGAAPSRGRVELLRHPTRNEPTPERPGEGLSAQAGFHDIEKVDEKGMEEMLAKVKAVASKSADWSEQDLTDMGYTEEEKKAYRAQHKK